MDIEDSLRLELEAERHCHRKDNEYLTKRESELRAENERLRAALQYVLDDEPNLLPRATSSCRDYIRRTLGQ